MASFVETRGHAGDEGDFEALYETYKSDVQRLASYLLKNASDAEDAAQTVFLNVLRALRQGVTPSDPRAWLLAITRNVCFSRHRAAAARPSFVELDFEPSEDPSGEETPSADEIVGALARMLPNQRTALILRDFRGVSRSEIGRLMALSPAAVEALLTRARAVFREELAAGEQPFVCAETRALVEKQLDGEITVADRHTLRSHLRHCRPCATLARAVRSSRGKLAGLIFWPFDLISRVAGAFFEAPSITHVAAAIGSTAAVAAVAIPVAVSTSSGPAVAVRPTATHAAAAAPVPVPDSTPAARVSRPAAIAAMHAAAPKPAGHAGLQRQAPHKAKSASKHSAHARAAGGTSVVAPTHIGTPSTGTITTPLRPTQSAPPSTSDPTTTASSQTHSGITTPTSASPRSTSLALVAPLVVAPLVVAPLVVADQPAADEVQPRREAEDQAEERPQTRQARPPRARAARRHALVHGSRRRHSVRRRRRRRDFRPGRDDQHRSEPRRVPVVELGPGQQPVRELRRRLLEQRQRQRQRRQLERQGQEGQERQEQGQAKALVVLEAIARPPHREFARPRVFRDEGQSGSHFESPLPRGGARAVQVGPSPLIRRPVSARGSQQGWRRSRSVARRRARR